MSDPIHTARELGQSIWYDDLNRGLFTSGALARMVAEGLGGETSNPTWFARAIGTTTEYDADLAKRASHGHRDPRAIFEALALPDVRRAADVLRPVYDRTNGRDGFVSFEVSPKLAHDAARTIEEARRLFAAIGRDNVMIKVPGTPEGAIAVERLTALGVNVNITLLFGIEAYRAVAEAYFAGLEHHRGDLARIASVASFFLSRIDVLVDPQLERAPALRGKTAIASARLAYRAYQEMIASPRWQALARRGARSQRLLWASTTPKDPAYSPMHYVDGLVGPDTINTMTEETYRAFRDHGTPHTSIADGVREAEHDLAALAALGISLPEVTDTLVREGIAKFETSERDMLAAIERKASAA